MVGAESEELLKVETGFSCQITMILVKHRFHGKDGGRKAQDRARDRVRGKDLPCFEFLGAHGPWETTNL